MKSLYVILTLSVAIVAVVSHEELNDDQKKLANFALDCMEKENASEDDLKAIGEFTMPDTREGQCMAACIAEKIGMIKAGKFSPEGAVEGVSMLAPKNDPDRQSAIQQTQIMAQECNVENADRCKLILDIIDCFHD